jgi:hypothetical protein
MFYYMRPVHISSMLSGHANLTEMNNELYMRHYECISTMIAGSVMGYINYKYLPSLEEYALDSTQQA